MNEVFARWPNFQKEELLSPGGLALVRQGVMPLDVDSVDMLQMFRKVVNVPLMINTPLLLLRGYRTPEENREIYQTKRVKSSTDKPYQPDDNRFSFHIQGKAFDISSAELTPGQLYIRAKEFGFKGLGVYKTFVHIDNRFGKRVEWIGI